MPKIRRKMTNSVKLYIKRFQNEGLEVGSYARTPMCTFCHKSVSTTTKYQVEQHIRTFLHCQNKLRIENSRSKQKKLDNVTTWHTYNKELVETCMAADIPLHKLDNERLRSFLAKYTNYKQPTRENCRSKYVDVNYNLICLNNLREKIGDSEIWFPMDETTDSDGRNIGNIIIGKLDADPSESYLLNCVEMERCDAVNVAKLVNTSLTILWPRGILYEKAFLMVSDRVRYMKKAGRDLKTSYPNMIHVTCLAHGLHNLCETIQSHSDYEDVNKLIAETKKVFTKAPNRAEKFSVYAPGIPFPPKPILTRWGTWLEACVYYADNFEAVKNVVEKLRVDAKRVENCQELFKAKSIKHRLTFIKSSFGFLPNVIQSLEKRSMPIFEVIELVDDCLEKVKKIKKANFAFERLNDILMDNPGLVYLREFANILAGKDDESTEAVDKYGPAKLVLFKYAPLTSCDVERSFSMFKCIYRDNRKRFTFENLRKYIFINCNKTLL